RLSLPEHRTTENAASDRALNAAVRAIRFRAAASVPPTTRGHWGLASRRSSVRAGSREDLPSRAACEYEHRRGSCLRPWVTFLTIQHLISELKLEDVPCACAFVIPATGGHFEGNQEGTALVRICGTSMKRAPTLGFSTAERRSRTIWSSVTRPNLLAWSRVDGIRSQSQYIGNST